MPNEFDYLIINELKELCFDFGKCSRCPMNIICEDKCLYEIPDSTLRKLIETAREVLIMAKLKPCPFCGKNVADVLTDAEASGIEEENEMYPIWKETYTVVCDSDKGGCGASCGCGHNSEEEAIRDWNMRS